MSAGELFTGTGDMQPYQAKIRQMTPADAGSVFALRRNSILEEPLAFLASPEDDVASSVDAVRELLEHAPESVVFGAEAGEPGELVGMLGVYRENLAKAAHKVRIWGMYVVPAYRGKSIGSQLLRSALLHAAHLEGVATVNLTVAETAESARRLYERAGFSVWGLEPDAIRHGPDAVAEYHMQLVLDKVAEPARADTITREQQE